MVHHIVSLEKIESEARAAARAFVDINSACPYSFYSPQGQAFKKAFTAERTAMLMANTQPRREAK